MGPAGADAGDGDANVLLKAIAKQEQVLRSMQTAHGEFHPSVSDDLAQLALLYSMNGEFEKALPLLHKRLVIHEKFGPGEKGVMCECVNVLKRLTDWTDALLCINCLDELTGETLQDLGTIYRLHSVPEVALQHFERALAIRERCFGKDSLKVAETLNSLALVSLVRDDSPQAEAFQLRSLQVLFDSSEPEDIESEDVPWEVYKRLKQQRGPSTSRNSVTLLKGNMRKRVMEVVYAMAPPPPPLQLPATGVGNQQSEPRGGRRSGPSSPTKSDDLSMKRATRSHSDSGAMKRYVTDNAVATTAEESGERAFRAENTVVEHHYDPRRATSAATNGGRNRQELVDSLHIHVQPSNSNSAPSSATTSTAVATANRRLTPPAPPFHPYHQPQYNAPPSPPTGAFPPPPHQQQRQAASPIPDFSTLQHRVEGLKRRISAGYAADADEDIARLAADIDAVQARELREVGFAMLSLVREMNRLRIKSDSARNLPVLEGMLEKKSASIFRGWEKRWFKVDAKTFVLSYHFSKDDYSRGFAPRGGFPVSRISNILVHRHARGSHYHFDVVVDLSTRLNPHASRTYELRCEDQETLRFWVETLHYYKATAQTTPVRPSTS